MRSLLAWTLLAALLVSLSAERRRGKGNQKLPEQVFPERSQPLAARLEVNANDAPPAVAGRSTGRLATGMLSEVYNDLGAKVNNVVSPLSLWIVLVMLLEAAGGKTREQIAQLLSAKENPQSLKATYKFLDKALPEGKGGVKSELKTMMVMRNFMVRDKNVELTPQVNETYRKDYQTVFFTLDPLDLGRPVEQVNKWVADTTENRIKEIVTAKDFENLKFLLGNAVLFRGRWKFPFPPAATFADQFKDEGEKIQGPIPMMTHRLVLKYAYSDQFESQIVEIPYSDDKTSMVVLLPRRKVDLASVLSRLKGLSLAEVLPPLTDEEVDLYLPRFNVTTDITLNKVLYSLGAQDMLNEGPAEFPGMNNGGYVSRVVQKAEIENNEEGTQSSAATSAQVSYKTSSVTFHANRPFLYFINDIATRTVLFAGTLSNPNSS